MDIKPHIGFGKIKFGLTEAQVTKLMGKPSHREINDEEGEPDDVTLEYETYSIDLTFAADDGHKLGAITFYAKDYLLFGNSYIGLSEQELLKKIAKAGVTDLELDFEEEEVDSKNYSSDSQGLLFWIQDGVVDSVSLLPEYEDNGDIVIWPG